MHKAGFVSIVGKPNTGKSTLMNQLVGERLSIITSKAQTTRHRIMGILSGENFQIIYSDTPGVIKPAYKLQESMMDFVSGALEDADLVLLVTDITDQTPNPDLVERMARLTVPLIVVVNKIDLADQPKTVAQMAHWKEVLPNATTIVPVSALHNFNVAGLFDLILELLPEHPAYYDKDELTDKPERFFVAEIIREKILLNYEEEVPYSCEVVVNSFKEADDLVRIHADILVERDSQKAILIGKGGLKLKKVGTEARKDIETFLGKKVFLEQFVKVEKNWRSDERKLSRYGYRNSE